MTSARDKLKRFFESNVGKTITTEELGRVAGIASYARRIRELRQDGWPIMTNNDRSDLKPGEYRMEDNPHKNSDTYVVSRNISQRLRAEVLERNGYTCQMCGAGAGDVDADNHSRKVRLHIGHVIDHDHGGRTEKSNLRAMCSTCNQGAKNLAQEPPSWTWLLSQIRRANVDDQKKALAWLKGKLDKV